MHAMPEPKLHEIFTINISLGMDSKRDFVGTKVGPSHIINNLYLSVR